MLQLLLMRLQKINHIYIWFLLANLEDILRPVNARSIILGIFDPFYHKLDGNPLGALDECWAKRTLFQFDLFKTYSEAGRLINLEIDAPSLTGISCTCGNYCSNMRMLLLFSGVTLDLWLGNYIGSSSRYGIKQVSLMSILYGAPLCEMRCTISAYFGGIVPSLINVTVEKSSSKTTWNLGEIWPVSGFITRANDHAWNSEWPR